MPAKCYEAPVMETQRGWFSNARGYTKKSRDRQERCLFNPFVRRNRSSYEVLLQQFEHASVFPSMRQDAQLTSLLRNHERLMML